MIKVKATIYGEADMPPVIKVFEFNDNDEVIFYNTVEVVKEKLAKNLKINVNETLTVYCAYVVSEICAGKSFDIIENNATKILTIDNVMIGVPETLRKISFEATIDKLPKKHITFEEPIPTSSYILSNKIHRA